MKHALYTQSDMDELLSQIDMYRQENEELIALLDNKPQVSSSSNGSLSRMVEDLLLNTMMTYGAIVARVREEHPQANTSTKSVASVACTMRRKGLAVPKRVMY